MQQFFNYIYPFDNYFICLFAKLNESAGAFFTPLSKIVTLLGEKGIIFFITAIILSLFKKTRKSAVCIFGAVCCGALITNIILKDTAHRLRPFESSSVYYDFWVNAGSFIEDGFSFPSGHVTAVSSFATATFLTFNKKFSWTAFLGVIIMAFSRVYLLAHYPSDVIAGALVGIISGVIAYYITLLIFKLLNKYKSKKVCCFLLNFDIKNNLKGLDLDT